MKVFINFQFGFLYGCVTVKLLTIRKIDYMKMHNQRFSVWLLSSDINVP